MSTQQLTLIKAGKFARLLKTTKRTILFYDEFGVLKPFCVDKHNYRYYKPEQLIDFKVISLLRNQGMNLDEIKKYVKDGYTFKEIFNIRKKEIHENISLLKNTFEHVDTFYSNLTKDNENFEANIIKMRAFDFYYIVRTGPYSKALDYANELKDYFTTIPQNSTFINFFLDHKLDLEKTRMMIAVKKDNKMKLSKRGEEVVEQDSIRSYWALSHKFEGPKSLLPLYWDNLRKYKKVNGYLKDKKIPYGVDFYLQSELNGMNDENKNVLEIQIPIMKD